MHFQIIQVTIAYICMLLLATVVQLLAALLTYLGGSTTALQIAAVLSSLHDSDGNNVTAVGCKC